METLLAALALGGLGFASSAYGASKNKQTGFAMNKESWKYYQLQKEFDYKYDSGKYLDLDKEYNNWYKQLEYDWKKQYAENSAKWNVEGLKNAGLNPILAASGGFTPSQMTSGPVSAQRHSSGSALGNSADMKSDWDIAGNTASLMGTAKTAALLGSEIKEARAKAEVADKTTPVQIDAAKKQNELLEAQKNKAASDAAASLASAEKAKRETADLADRRGYTGEAANAILAARDLGQAGNAVINQVKHTASDNTVNKNDTVELADGRKFENNPQQKEVHRSEEQHKVDKARMEGNHRWQRENGRTVPKRSTRRHN